MLQITNVQSATTIFALILLISLLLSVSRREHSGRVLSINDSMELRGFAILAIILAHIGYFLVSDNRFLQPLSFFAGPAVDIFLFLSGYGLTVSILKSNKSILQFYQSRLTKLYIPMWLAFIAILMGNYFILNKTFPSSYIINSFFGIYRTSELGYEINSPLWYFTFTLLYYLLFPVIFNKKLPWLSALLLFLLGLLGTQLDIVILRDVVGVYKLHIIAFPLGILFAWFLLGDAPLQLKRLPWLNNFLNVGILRTLIALIFLASAYYLGVNSGVGKGWIIESLVSNFTMVLLVGFFILKSFKIKLLNLFGVYSYEIFLIHWPFAYFTPVLWEKLPAWLALVVYLSSVLASGVVLQKAAIYLRSKWIEKK